MADRASREGHYDLPLMFISFLFISFFRRLILEVAWAIATKLCHMFDG